MESELSEFTDTKHSLFILILACKNIKELGKLDDKELVSFVKEFLKSHYNDL